MGKFCLAPEAYIDKNIYKNCWLPPETRCCPRQTCALSQQSCAGGAEGMREQLALRSLTPCLSPCTACRHRCSPC